MWTYKNEDVVKEIGAQYINESGCYACKIKRVQVLSGSNGSMSKGVRFEIEANDSEGRFDIWFIGKDGKETYSVAMLNQLCYKLKLNPRDFNFKEEEGFNGSKITVIEQFKDKVSGVFLEHFYDEYNGKVRTKLNCKGFFDTDTGKTTSEEKNNVQEPKKLNYWKSKFEERNNTLQKPEPKKNDDPYGYAETTNDIQSTIVETTNDDEFPFN